MDDVQIQNKNQAQSFSQCSGTNYSDKAKKSFYFLIQLDMFDKFQPERQQRQYIDDFAIVSIIRKPEK